LDFSKALLAFIDTTVMLQDEGNLLNVNEAARKKTQNWTTK